MDNVRKYSYVWREDKHKNGIIWKKNLIFNPGPLSALTETATIDKPDKLVPTLRIIILELKRS